MTHPTLNELSLRLSRRETTSRALIEESLARIADPEGEGGRLSDRLCGPGPR